MTGACWRVGCSALLRLLASLPYRCTRARRAARRAALLVSCPAAADRADQLAAVLPGNDRSRAAAVPAGCFPVLRPQLLRSLRALVWPAERIRELVRDRRRGASAAVGDRPGDLLAPHFVGLDAGGARLTLDRRSISMYRATRRTRCSTTAAGVREPLQRPVLFSRQDGDLRTAIRAMRQGVPFYFLPDMDLGADDAVFVPFFGVQAATAAGGPGWRRWWARRSSRRDRDDRHGYVCSSIRPGTTSRVMISRRQRRMNRFIEARTLEMPAQYLWTHKRFKTRPPGEAIIYWTAGGAGRLRQLRRRRWHANRFHQDAWCRQRLHRHRCHRRTGGTDGRAVALARRPAFRRRRRPDPGRRARRGDPGGRLRLSDHQQPTAARSSSAATARAASSVSSAIRV